MRILDYGLVFVVAFSIVFSGAHLLAGSSPLQQFESGMNAVGGLVADTAFADENPNEPIDFSKLIRIDGREFEVTMDPGVQTDVLSQSVIRKIGYGRVSEVNVVRTPSGTYSSDALASPHIKYSGIDVVAKAALEGPAMFWQTGFGWMALPNTGESFTITSGRTVDGARYVSTGKQTCIRARDYLTCG